jgi:hypothetical protein
MLSDFMGYIYYKISVRFHHQLGIIHTVFGFDRVAFTPSRPRWFPYVHRMVLMSQCLLVLQHDLQGVCHIKDTLKII